MLEVSVGRKREDVTCLLERLTDFDVVEAVSKAFDITSPACYNLVAQTVGISSRRRTVVRLPLPQAVSLSVKALWQVMYQKRRLSSTNSTACPRNWISRLRRGSTSCCLTHGSTMRAPLPFRRAHDFHPQLSIRLHLLLENTQTI